MIGDKLKKILNEQKVSQKELSEKTGISANTISSYANNGCMPSDDKLAIIANALAVDVSAFISKEKTKKHNMNFKKINISVDNKNLSVTTVATLMGKSPDFVKKGLQDGVFPFGYAVKMQEWSYYISPIKFTEYTGILIEDKEEVI